MTQIIIHYIISACHTSPFIKARPAYSHDAGQLKNRLLLLLLLIIISLALKPKLRSQGGERKGKNLGGEKGNRFSASSLINNFPFFVQPPLSRTVVIPFPVEGRGEHY